jgi:hypothetical protein
MAALILGAQRAEDWIMTTAAERKSLGQVSLHWNVQRRVAHCAVATWQRFQLRRLLHARRPLANFDVFVTVFCSGTLHDADYNTVKTRVQTLFSRGINPKPRSSVQMIVRPS